MLSIHNLSAGTQNVTGAYVIIMLVYRHLPNNYVCCAYLIIMFVYRLLLTMRLHGKAAM